MSKTMNSKTGPRRGRAGFTLTELMIVMGIVSVVGSIILQMLLHMTDFWELSTAQTNLGSAAQTTMNTMTRDLLNATRKAAGTPPNIVIPAPPGNTSIQFYLPADLDGNGFIIDNAGNIEWDMLTPLQFQYVAAARELRQVVGVSSRVLATDVDSVMFDDQSTDATLYADEVRIRITMRRTTPRGRTVTTSSNTVMKLRN